jgi:hypothetical protein
VHHVSRGRRARLQAEIVGEIKAKPQEDEASDEECKDDETEGQAPQSPEFRIRARLQARRNQFETERL